MPISAQTAFILEIPILLQGEIKQIPFTLFLFPESLVKQLQQKAIQLKELESKNPNRSPSSQRKNADLMERVAPSRQVTSAGTSHRTRKSMSLQDMFEEGLVEVGPGVSSDLPRGLASACVCYPSNTLPSVRERGNVPVHQARSHRPLYERPHGHMGEPGGSRNRSSRSLMDLANQGDNVDGFARDVDAYRKFLLSDSADTAV